MKSLMCQAMSNPDEFVVEMSYRDSRGQTSRRVISPIRWLSSDRLLALCLCREEPRQFYWSRCSELRLAKASDFLMPVPLQ